MPAYDDMSSVTYLEEMRRLASEFYTVVHHSSDCERACQSGDIVTNDSSKFCVNCLGHERPKIQVINSEPAYAFWNPPGMPPNGVHLVARPLSFGDLQNAVDQRGMGNGLTLGPVHLDDEEPLEYLEGE